MVLTENKNINLCDWPKPVCVLFESSCYQKAHFGYRLRYAHLSVLFKKPKIVILFIFQFMLAILINTDKW